MEQKSFSKLTSDTISALRFPLMVGIVFIHFGVSEGITVQGVEYGANAPYWLVCINNLFSKVLPTIGVPLFFLMSGYLFFWSGLSLDSYKRKIKKRARTLLVPYILWCLIFLAFTATLHTPTFKFLIPNAPDGNWSIGSFLATFWDDNQYGVYINPEKPIIEKEIYPACRPMWYVRELMIVMLASPIFYYAIKKMGWYVVALLGLMWYIVDPLKIGHPGQIATAAFFFSWGACYAIRNVDLVASMRKFRIWIWLYVPIAIVDMMTKEWDYSDYLHDIGIVVGVVAAVVVMSYLLEKGKVRVNKFLSSSSFFLFALHFLFMRLMAKAVLKVYVMDSPYFMLLLYFFIPTVTILICLAAYWLLHRFTPRLCALLTGGR